MARVSNLPPDRGWHGRSPWRDTDTLPELALEVDMGLTQWKELMKANPQPRMSDLLNAWGADGGPVAVALHREMWDVEIVAYFSMPGEPQSKSRARVTMKRGKVSAYTPRQTAAAEEKFAWLCKASLTTKQPDTHSTFGVFAAFFCGTQQRRDVDNMLKLVLDGLTGVVWADDSQVTEVSGRLRRGMPSDEARTEVIVYKTIRRMTGAAPTRECKRCGAHIRIYPSTPDNKAFCSKECRNDYRRIRGLRDCKHCGKEFIPAGGEGHVYCSKACRAIATTVALICANCKQPIEMKQSTAATRRTCSTKCQADLARKSPLARESKAKCVDCGRPLSKVKYTRCRACSLERRMSIRVDQRSK